MPCRLGLEQLQGRSRCLVGFLRVGSRERERDGEGEGEELKPGSQLDSRMPSLCLTLYCAFLVRLFSLL